MSSREDLSADSGSNQGRSNIGSHKTISGWGVCSSKHEFCAQDFDIVHLGINGIGHMVRSDGLEVIRHVNNRFFGSASGGLSRVNEVDSIGFISPRRGRKLARNGREERLEYAGNVLHDERVVRGLRLAMAILYLFPLQTYWNWSGPDHNERRCFCHAANIRTRKSFPPRLHLTSTWILGEETFVAVGIFTLNHSI